MRILLLATYFPKPGNRLIGTWARDQAHALQRAGAELEVISLTPWVPRWPGQPAGIRAYSECPPSADWDGLRVHYPRWLLYPVAAVEGIYFRNPGPWVDLAWSLCRRRVLALARQWNPDVIFAHHTCVNGRVAQRVAIELRRPFVCQDHAMWEISGCDEFPKRRRLFADIARSAALMLGVSRQMAADIRRIAPDSRVEVLHNGANLAPSSLRRMEPARCPPTIFSAGMLVGYKGFDILLEAWARVQVLYPGARLRIAGDGPERARLLEQRARLGLTASVEFLGSISQPDVQGEMAAARAFVLASWNETFGVVFMEAASNGSPLVWVKNAGAADLLEDGVHGIAIAPHDAAGAAEAIVFFLANPEKASRMGAASARLVQEQGTWDAVARRALGLFSTAGAGGAATGE